MALAPLAELAQSYLDVRSHLDPPLGARFGRFAADALRPNIAALKSLTSALEELEPDALDDEIDRTALLNDVRVLIYRCERERVFARDPAQWVQRIVDGASFARMADVPAFLDDARAALTDPVSALAHRAAGLLPQARQAVDAAGGDPGALKALARFAEDLEAWVEDGKGRLGVGEDAFNFHLHFEHALRETAPELWRQAHRLVEGESTESESFPARMESDDLSLIRKMVRAPLTADGWELCRNPQPVRLRRHAVAALLDIGIHTRDLSVAAGVALLRQHLEIEQPEAETLVRQTAAAPTHALSASIGRREWLRMRESFPSSDALNTAVRPYGDLPISLMRWGLGLGD